MEAIATCIEGLESITQLEIKEILKQKSEIVIPSRIKFKVKDEKDLANFIYNTRSSIKVYKFIDSFTFESLNDLLDKIKKVKFPNITSPFVVRSERIGEHDFKSLDIEKEVDLKNPTTIVLIDIINNNCFVGIDYTGIKLSKRLYRIRLMANSLNSCLAYSMLRISEAKDKETILDPFCKSGEIPIEAALYFNKIPLHQKQADKLAFQRLVEFTPKNKPTNKKLKIYAVDASQNNLKSIEINAKIAGINKSIIFSRYDIEWLDTKLEKNSIDKIITFPAYPTNIMPKDQIEKIYKELFYQSEFVLKTKGTITILTPCPELIEKQALVYKFMKEKEYKINYVHQQFTILVLKK